MNFLYWLEAWLVSRLLNSQKFHSAVGRVHQKVHHLRHGEPPHGMGATDKQPAHRRPGFLDYFKEELKDQLKGKPRDKS